MSLRVGSVVFATDQGLGVLAKSFHDHGVVTDVVVVRHGSRPTHAEWYPGAPQVADLRNRANLRRLEEFCAGVDVMLFFETPFHWPLLDHCRRRGVRTALMPMYECMPRELPAQPDLFLCPSQLDLRYYPERSVFLPVPVEVPWRLRERAEVFVHNAGWGGLKGRNGTAELLEAWQYVKSPARLVVRSQSKLVVGNTDPRIAYHVGTVPHESLWAEGDVCLHPTRFDGLSLPLQEARAAGLLCMTLDRFPVNEWLPRAPLIPVDGYQVNSVSPRCHPFQEAVVEPRTIARCVDAWFGADLRAYSEAGRAWAQANSWAVWGPRYWAVLEGLCASST